MGQVHHVFICSEMMGFFHKDILMWESVLCYLLQLSLRIQLTLLKIRRTLEFQEQHYQRDKHQPQVHSGFPFQAEDIRPHQQKSPALYKQGKEGFFFPVGDLDWDLCGKAVNFFVHGLHDC